MKEWYIRNRKWFVAVVGILILWRLLFGGDDGLSQEEFEEELKTLSDGQILVSNSGIAELEKESLYMADWNGFIIVTRVEKGKLTLPYAIMTPQIDTMNEISIGQYRQLAASLSGVADSSLSVDERYSIVDNQLNFNSSLFVHREFTTAKGKFEYSLEGADSTTPFSSFTVYKEGQQKEIQKVL